MATIKKDAEPEQDVFTKEALLASGYFDNRKDALAVVVGDSEEITIDEARARLNRFMKRKVK